MSPISPLPRSYNPLETDLSTSISPTSTISPSRSPPPPYSGITSKILSLPMGIFSSPKMDGGDLEKAAFLPSTSTSTHASTALPHLGLRRRRLLGQALAVLGLLSIGGYLVLSPQDVSSLLDTSGWSNSHPSIADNYQIVDGDTPIPGVMIGADGVAITPPPKTLSHAEKMAELASIKPQEWGLSLSASRLLQGLQLWPDDPPTDDSTPALSVLGHFADDIYKYGPLEMTEYSAQLYEFIREAFPKKVAAQLAFGLKNYVPPLSKSQDDEMVSGRGEPWDKNKLIWQTDKDTKYEGTADVASWRSGSAIDEGWRWDLMTDAEADKYLRKKLAGSKILEVWNNLPSGILRSDTLRYIMLLLEGGIYSDTDTALLKSPSKWGQSARLWKDGQGWMSEEEKARIGAGENVDVVLGKPSVVVGVEADVGDREDWFDWWPRPIQIVQWTMASTPSHPIALQAVLRILHSTASAIDWAHDNARVVKILKDQGRYEDAKHLAGVTVLDEPKNGGPVGVMAWTGPGVWTDAVLSYLRVKFGLVWTDLKGIQEPLRVGDVVILPVTGFSPGVGNFGSQGTWHREAMVQHKFRGSWKPSE